MVHAWFANSGRAKPLQIRQVVMGGARGSEIVSGAGVRRPRTPVVPRVHRSQPAVVHLQLRHVREPLRRALIARGVIELVRVLGSRTISHGAVIRAGRPGRCCSDNRTHQYRRSGECHGKDEASCRPPATEWSSRKRGSPTHGLLPGRMGSVTERRPPSADVAG